MKPARGIYDDPTELDRLLEEALRCLKGTDLHGANAALERAVVEVEALYLLNDAAAPGPEDYRGERIKE